LNDISLILLSEFQVKAESQKIRQRARKSYKFVFFYEFGHLYKLKIFAFLKRIFYSWMR